MCVIRKYTHKVNRTECWLIRLVDHLENVCFFSLKTLELIHMNLTWSAFCEIATLIFEIISSRN
jgi:hypothetical protein